MTQQKKIKQELIKTLRLRKCLLTIHIVIKIAYNWDINYNLYNIYIHDINYEQIGDEKP